MKSSLRLLLGVISLFVFSLLSKCQFDFMKFVTRMALRNHLGNKFHEIMPAVFGFARLYLLVRVRVASEWPT